MDRVAGLADRLYNASSSTSGRGYHSSSANRIATQATQLPAAHCSALHDSSKLDNHSNAVEPPFVSVNSSTICPILQAAGPPDDPSTNPVLLPPRTRVDIVQDRPAGGTPEEVAAANPALAAAVPETVGKDSSDTGKR